MAGKTINQLEFLTSPVSLDTAFVVGDPLLQESANAFKTTAPAIGAKMFELIDWPLTVTGVATKTVKQDSIGPLVITGSGVLVEEQGDYDSLQVGYLIIYPRDGDAYTVVDKLEDKYISVEPTIPDGSDLFEFAIPSFRGDGHTIINEAYLKTNDLWVEGSLTVDEITASGEGEIVFSDGVKAEYVGVGVNPIGESGRLEANSILVEHIRATSTIGLSGIKSGTGEDIMTFDPVTGAINFKKLARCVMRSNPTGYSQYFPIGATPTNVIFDLEDTLDLINPSVDFDAFTFQLPGMYNITTSGRFNPRDDFSNGGQLIALIKVDGISGNPAEQRIRLNGYTGIDTSVTFNMTASVVAQAGDSVRVVIYNYLTNGASESLELLPGEAHLGITHVSVAP